MLLEMVEYGHKIEKKWPKLKNRSKLKKKKMQLSNEGIANLSDAQFKTLVIRMLTEMVECGPKTEEEVKAIKSEINKNVREGNQDSDQ